jgi:thermolysin
VAAHEREADAWGARIDAWAADGRLSLLRVQRDAELPGRRHLRYEQRIGGVPVLGGELVRQLDPAGRTLSVSGRWLEAVEIDLLPVLSPAAAALVGERVGGRTSQPPTLVVLPLDGRARLAYSVRTADGPRLWRSLVDARSGDLLLAWDDLHTEAAVGVGTGVLGDRKKVSANHTAEGYEADDRLRPASLVTLDFKLSSGAAFDFYGSRVPPPGAIARDADNVWDDRMVVDAHAHLGYAYDYLFLRHGRHGIDDADRPVPAVVHALAGYANAFWHSDSQSLTLGDGDADYLSFAAGLDVVAHELAHGVTQHTWRGLYFGEPGALHESFSDIMGTATEFFFQPAGDGPLKADYWLGEDTGRSFDPPRYAARSMAHPRAICSAEFGCDPDHYSVRYRGTGDSQGIHHNAGISNQAFYLLVEGGVNGTSGLRVEGLGASNRERAEKIFFRAFTLHLTPAADFRAARAATLQAARDLYGAGSREETQVAAAWTAVGVE